MPTVKKKCQFILYVKLLDQRERILFIIEMVVSRVSASFTPVIRAPSSTGWYEVTPAYTVAYITGEEHWSQGTQVFYNEKLAYPLL